MRSLVPPPAPALRPQRPQLREGLLLLGFLLVLAAAVMTVVIPELSKEPDEGGPSTRPAPAAPVAAAPAAPAAKP